MADSYQRWGGTRLGRAELEGEVLWDTPGALWSRDVLDATRVSAAPDLRRIMIGVDPAVSADEGSDLTGIVAAGCDDRGHLYILADRSVQASPATWAARVVALFDDLRADRVVAEANQGGAMVESTLRTVRADLPVTLVHASRGRITRAESVCALWEQGRAHVVGVLSDLEDELTSFAPGPMEQSPDRADAMVWIASQLMGGGNWEGLLLWMKQEEEKVTAASFR